MEGSHLMGEDFLPTNRTEKWYIQPYHFTTVKLLLHTCCAPCLTGSRIPLEEEGFEVTAYWFNPNIHPYTEYEKRLQTFQRYLFLEPVEHIIEEGYPLYEFIRGQMDPSGSIPVADDNSRSQTGLMPEERRKNRCEYCYRTRLKKTASTASERGFDCFSTTMLLSKHQDHEGIRRYCRELSDEYSIDFIYRDLRKNWKDSVRISREMRLYRQPYCGCIFSEYERYA